MAEVKVQYVYCIGPDKRTSKHLLQQTLIGWMGYERLSKDVQRQLGINLPGLEEVNWFPLALIPGTAHVQKWYLESDGAKVTDFTPFFDGAGRLVGYLFRSPKEVET